MKYHSEYADPKNVDKIVKLITSKITKPYKIMEICGGQTHSILKYGLDKLLPDIEFLHGPGCPVCVTPIEVIDHAIEIAQLSNVIFCSFGDMLRVPGSKGNLLSARANGAKVNVVYSPLDAVTTAKENLEKEIVFFAIGFETTSPANAMAIKMAVSLGLSNFSVLVSQFLVPPAIEAIMAAENTAIDAFLAAGHVCTVMGYTEYETLAEKYHVPIVVTGFEPMDLLQGVYHCVCQLEDGISKVENQYNRVVYKDGNKVALQLLKEYFVATTKPWRGIGEIPNSCLVLSDKYQKFNAAIKFADLFKNEPLEQKTNVCIAGDILKGIKKPTDCPVFSVECNPESPLGAPMVSAEGVCAAYYNYRKLNDK